MNSNHEKTRWEEIVELWQTTPTLYAIAGFLVGLMFFPLLNAIFMGLGELLNSLLPEFIGVFMTVVFIDRLIDRLNKRAAEREFKQRLVREAGSPANTTALHAVKELRAHKWLRGNTALLCGANLLDADLSRVKLSCADLIRTNFWYAQLKEATFYMSNLEGAEFWRADLTAAKFHWANMKETILAGAKLQGADLTNANLAGAILRGISVNNQKFEFVCPDVSNTEWEIRKESLPEEAKPWQVEFDHNTTLPNGQKWNAEIDMRRFTCPDHPHFYTPKRDNQGMYPWWHNQNEELRDTSC